MLLRVQCQTPPRTLPIPLALPLSMPQAEDMRVQPSTALELMALVSYAVTQQLRPIRFRAPGTSAGRAALAQLLRSIHTLQEDPDSSEAYTPGDGAVLDGMDTGCMIALGSVTDLQNWFSALEARPKLRLLTTSQGALQLMANFNSTPPAHASRLHFPFLTVPAQTNRTLAWQYGYVAAHAVVQALTRSGYATQTYTTVEHVVNAWYQVRLLLPQLPLSFFCGQLTHLRTRVERAGNGLMDSTDP